MAHLEWKARLIMVQEYLFHLRTCTRCKTTQATTNFSRNRTMPDGYSLHCKKCAAAYQKLWYEKNQTKVIKKSKLWREQNRDRFNASANQRRKQRVVKTRQQQREYEKRNPLVTRKKNHARRQRLSNIETKVISNKDLRRLYASPCANCGSSIDVCLDHVIPVARGGRHSIGNAQPLCRTCNASKGARLQVEWRHRNQAP